MRRSDKRYDFKKLFPGVGVWGAVLFLSLTALVWVTLSFRDEAVAQINFQDILQDDNVSSPAASGQRTMLKIAVFPRLSPSSTRKYYRKLLDLVGNRSGLHVVFYQKETPSEILNMLQYREIDLAFVSSGAYVAGHRQFGLELLASPVIDGGKINYSYILAGRESSINSLEDLRGMRFAFTDPYSYTGYLSCVNMLMRKGERADSFFSDVFFSYSHENSIKAVAEGLADGAAVDSSVWKFMNSENPSYTSKTKIIARSLPCGTFPVVVDPCLEKELKQKLQRIFLLLHKDPEGAAILGKLRIDSFEKGEDSLYDPIRRLRGM